jgi:hypothetical protein
MAGSPSHSVRDIQEPPRSWVGVCADPRTVHHGAVPELARASSGWGNTVVNQSDLEQPPRKRQRRRGGAGPEANRTSVRLKRQVKSEMSFPPCETSFFCSSVASCGRHVANVRRSGSKRLTYCFDRPRMRTLGSLTTLPETPVVRNARQPFVYDDRYRRSEPCDRQAFLRCNSFNSKNAFRARNAPSRFHPQIGSKASAANAEHEEAHGINCRTRHAAKAAAHAEL